MTEGMRKYDWPEFFPQVRETRKRKRLTSRKYRSRMDRQILGHNEEGGVTMMTKEQGKAYPFAALLTDVRILTENLRDFRKKYRSRTKTRKLMEKVHGYKLLGELAREAIVLEELTGDACSEARVIAYEANLEADNRDMKVQLKGGKR